MGYQGNQQLRAANEKIVYTNEMKEEFIRCMTDILYFAEKYCKIISLDSGMININLWEYQKRMLKAMVDPPQYKNEVGELENKKNIVVNCPRQAGKCLNYKEKIKIKNKKTGKIIEISIGEFHELIKK